MIDSKRGDTWSTKTWGDDDRHSAMLPGETQADALARLASFSDPARPGDGYDGPAKLTARVDGQITAIKVAIGAIIVFAVVTLLLVLFAPRHAKADIVEHICAPRCDQMGPWCKAKWCRAPKPISRHKKEQRT